MAELPHAIGFSFHPFEVLRLRAHPVLCCAVGPVEGQSIANPPKYVGVEGIGFTRCAVRRRTAARRGAAILPVFSHLRAFSIGLTPCAAAPQDPLRAEALRWPGAGLPHTPPPEAVQPLRARCAADELGAELTEADAQRQGADPDLSARSAIAAQAEAAAVGMAVRPGQGWLQQLQPESESVGVRGGTLQDCLPPPARCASGFMAFEVSMRGLGIWGCRLANREHMPFAQYVGLRDP